MGGKLTLNQMRVILLAGAILLLVLAYFLGFQPNMDSASEYQVKTEASEKHIRELEALKSEVKNLEIFTSLYNDDIKDYINSFPVKLTQQKSVYLLYRMMINTEVDVTSITPGTESPFYYKGNILTSDGDKAQAQEDAKKEAMSEITVVDMEHMVGNVASYTIELSGTTKQIYNCLDWITENDEKMSVGDVNIQFDKSTGKLSGTIVVNFYAMLGNGVAYKEPDTSGFAYGVKNVFGAVK